MGREEREVDSWDGWVPLTVSPGTIPTPPKPGRNWWAITPGYNDQSRPEARETQGDVIRRLERTVESLAARVAQLEKWL